MLTVVWKQLVDMLVKGWTSHGHSFRCQHCQTLRAGFSCRLCSPAFLPTLTSSCPSLGPYHCLISVPWFMLLLHLGPAHMLHHLNVAWPSRRCYKFQVPHKVFYSWTLFLESPVTVLVWHYVFFRICHSFACKYYVSARETLADLWALPSTY